jgi:hypothetical protein
MLTDKDYCDYETCVTLNGLGFPFRKIKVKGIEKNVPISLYEAQKWLREEKGIFVYIDVPWKTDDGLGWSYFCCNKPMTEEDKEVCFASGGFYDSYEEALSEGVCQAIEILKEK